MKERQLLHIEPYILLMSLLLRVNYVNQVVLLALGYGKDILVPFKEQSTTNGKRQTLLSLPLYGRKTNRLVASSKTNQFLKKEQSKRRGSGFDCFSYHRT
jgi:predicted RNA-binding protein (virulence factor B family)